MMATGGTSVHEVLPPYDSERRFKNGDPTVAGQVVRTVVPNLCEVWKLFDAQRADQVRHQSAEGVIRSVDERADYRPKPGRLPIFALRLGESEELLAIKSKMRPCIVLMTALGIPPEHLPNDWQRNVGRQAFQYQSFLVAPMFSTAQRDERKAFGPTMAARIECLVYPQFVYLPRTGGIIQNDSVVRLDRAFWTTLPPPSCPEQLFLSSQRMGVIQDQLRILQGDPASAEYLEMSELLQLELKAEHQAPR